jgi:hypothetical protein
MSTTVKAREALRSHQWIAAELSSGAVVLFDKEDAAFFSRPNPYSEYLGSVPVEHYRSYMWLGG